MNRRDLEPNMIIETSLRGVNDLGWTFMQDGVLCCGFIDGTIVHVQSYWDMDLMLKSEDFFREPNFEKFTGDHIIRIRKPQFYWQRQRENFVHAPIVWDKLNPEFYMNCKNPVARLKPRR